MSGSELGNLLRALRESVAPADVGLPTGPRRRTPGLRRAELAAIAGVSVEYLTRLEQGRDTRPSDQVLAALADALHLTTESRRLLLLSAKGTSGAACPESRPPTNAVRPTVMALLNQLEPGLAVVLNPVGDILTTTKGFERFARPVGLLDGSPPNTHRFVFADPRAREVLPDWERVADRAITELRLASFGADPHVRVLTDELSVTGGTAFTERLADPATALDQRAVERLVHPEAGELRFLLETLELADDAQRILVRLPADDATSAALARLTGRRPGALRAVSD